MTDNSDEGAFWSGPAGAKWIEHEAEQDHFLSGIAAAVVREAGLSRGQRVLDIGCGTGAVSLLAATAVGSEGHVLATDIAPPFVDRVKQRAKHLAHVSADVGDAQTATWPEPLFDAALSRFGVMFFSDPSAAFANIARALRPGGRMVFAAWGHVKDNPYWREPRRLVDELIAPQKPGVPNAPGPMGLADADWTVERMRAAGLDEVAVETRDIPLLHEGGAAGAADLSLRIGPAVRPLAEVEATEDQIAAFKAEVTRAFQPYESNGLARIPSTVHLYTARRA